MPVFRAYPQANSIGPTDALELDRIGVGTMFVEGLNLVAGAPYVVSLECLGTPPTASELIGIHVFPTAVNFAAGFSTMKLYSDTPATVDQVVTAYQIHNGAATSLGTWTATAGSHYAVSTTITGALAFANGDAVRCVAPVTPDVTWANFTWSFVGAVAP